MFTKALTRQVIQRELYQNLGSAIAAIFLTVLMFLASLRGAGLVLFCVTATIIEVPPYIIIIIIMFYSVIIQFYSSFSR